MKQVFILLLMTVISASTFAQRHWHHRHHWHHHHYYHHSGVVVHARL